MATSHPNSTRESQACAEDTIRTLEILLARIGGMATAAGSPGAAGLALVAADMASTYLGTLGGVPPLTERLAPTAPVPPAPGSESLVVYVPERDAAGLPWDSRIHSSTHGKVPDGSWKRRRNIPDEVFVDVAVELLAA